MITKEEARLKVKELLYNYKNIFKTGIISSVEL